MITNRNTAEWLRMCADLEHEHTLTDEEIRAIVKPRPPSEFAVKQASYNARAVEDERANY